MFDVAVCGFVTRRSYQPLKQAEVVAQSVTVGESIARLAQHLGGPNAELDQRNDVADCIAGDGMRKIEQRAQARD